MGENQRPHVVARPRNNDTPKPEKKPVEARPTEKLDSRELIGLVKTTRAKRTTEAELDISVEVAPAEEAATPRPRRVAQTVVRTVKRDIGVKTEMTALRAEPVRAAGSDPEIRPTISSPAAPAAANGEEDWSDLADVHMPVAGGTSPAVQIPDALSSFDTGPAMRASSPALFTPDAQTRVTAPGMHAVAPPRASSPMIVATSTPYSDDICGPTVVRPSGAIAIAAELDDSDDPFSETGSTTVVMQPEHVAAPAPTPVYEASNSIVISEQAAIPQLPLDTPRAVAELAPPKPWWKTLQMPTTLSRQIAVGVGIGVLGIVIWLLLAAIL